MISGLFFVNLKGEIIISRLYRDDVSVSAANAFRTQVIASKETGNSAPVRTIEGNTFLFTRMKDLFLVAVTRSNVNAGLVFQFLFSTLEVFKGYFGGEFDEETVRGSFTLVYELLDEILDFGYPQNCAFDVLKLYINLGSQVVPATAAEHKKITKTITGARDWRRDGIVHKKNEVFIDVLESVNLLVSSQGAVLRSDVTGVIKMNTRLTGMPECKFGLNDKLLLDRDTGAAAAGSGGGSRAVELDDVSFHRCVQLGKFEADRTITFVPPDGEFELMKYRITEGVNLPFRLLPVVEERSEGHVHMSIKVIGNFNGNLNATNVVFKIPTPASTAKARIAVPTGRAKYEPTAGAIVWRVKKFPGGSELTLTADVQLIKTTTKKTWTRPPISVDFNVSMFTASGLHVRNLKVYERSNYETIKWVKYSTRAGQYEVKF